MVESITSCNLVGAWPNYCGMSGSYILAATNGSKWLLSVNDVGALVTTETSGSVRGLTLVSDDSTHWSLSVNNLGVLVTTDEINPDAITSIILTSPDDSQYEVTVNNEGALITTEI